VREEDSASGWARLNPFYVSSLLSGPLFQPLTAPVPLSHTTTRRGGGQGIGLTGWLIVTHFVILQKKSTDLFFSLLCTVKALLLLCVDI
jgi:hypothetical protein